VNWKQLLANLGAAALAGAGGASQIPTVGGGPN
jgi:hypothetical protein